jgi:hypothetical protein
LASANNGRFSEPSWKNGEARLLKPENKFPDRDRQRKPSEKTPASPISTYRQAFELSENVNINKKLKSRRTKLPCPDSRSA